MDPFKVTGRSGWYVKYRDPIRPPGKQWVSVKGGDSLREAFVTQARLEEEAALLHRGVVTRQQLRTADVLKQSVSDLLEAWKRAMEDEQRSAAHVARYHSYARAVLSDQLPSLQTGGKRVSQPNQPGPRRINTLAELEAAVVGAFLGRLIRPPLNRSYATRNEYLTALKAFWLWAMGVKGQRKRVATPLDGLSKLQVSKDPRCERRAIDALAFEVFIAAVQSKGDLWKREGSVAFVQRRGRGANWYVAFYLVSGRAGGRWTETSKLRWRHANFEKHEITFAADIAKTGESGTVPMLPEVAAALLAIRPEGWKPDEPIFGGMPARRTFVRHLAMAGIKYLDAGRRVSLRKSLASQLIAKGVQPRSLQLIMRHKDIHTTMRHYSDPVLVDAHGALASLSNPTAARLPPKSAAG